MTFPFGPSVFFSYLFLELGLNVSMLILTTYFFRLFNAAEMSDDAQRRNYIYSGCD